MRVDVDRTSAEGLEAAARRARYAVFATQDADAVVLAHHLDDQAETLLLQLLRGAGPRGLAAMPAERPIAGAGRTLLLRPLLEVERARIQAYARRRELQWIEDESNADPQHDRNYLRHEILPRLSVRFPGYRQTWLRASRNFADLSEIADAQALADAAGALRSGGLLVQRLRELSRGAGGQSAALVSSSRKGCRCRGATSSASCCGNLPTAAATRNPACSWARRVCTGIAGCCGSRP